MMSAKTVTTETPATQAGNTFNVTSAPALAGPTVFQSVLAGAAPELPFVDTLPTQPLAQLVASKQQQAARAATLAAASAGAPGTCGPAARKDQRGRLIGVRRFTLRNNNESDPRALADFFPDIPKFDPVGRAYTSTVN